MIFTVPLSNYKKPSLPFVEVKDDCPLFDGVWGINRIGEGEQVAPGQQYTVYIASGTWDLRALACDGDTYWEQYEVSIDVSHEWELID